LFACVEIVETLKHQLATQSTQYTAQATQLTAAQQQLAAKDAQLTAAQQQNVTQATQLTAAQNEIQLLKSKLFQQSSSTLTQLDLPSQLIQSAQIKAALPPSTPESSPSKGQFFFFCV